MLDYAAARAHMVSGQIRPNKVTDSRLLEALSSVPRETFAPGSLRSVAYGDGDLPIGSGRYLPAPMVTARLIQEAGVRPGDAILDVAGGTGYTAALLGRLGRSVVAVESSSSLAIAASAALADAGADNVTVVNAPAEGGWPSQAPYDVIVVNGGVGFVPEALFDQLAEGGRLVAVVAQQEQVGRARLYLKCDGNVSSRILFDASLPLVPGFCVTNTFLF